MKKQLLKILSILLLVSIPLSAQWVTQTSGTTVTLRGVKAVNDNVVWACGGSGVVMKTTNGGTTWTQCTPTLSTVTNYSVEAFDTTTAWVTGTVGGSADVSIWKTTNGGATWTQQYNNPAGFGDGIVFFDANNGVYWGDPDPFPSTYWEILTTTNGGTTWTRVPRNNIAPADSVNQEIGAACSMSKFGNNVWFSGYYNVTTTNAPRIFKSTNRGLNWTASNIPLPSGTTSNYICFKDANNGVVVSLNGDVGRTTDGGSTWTFTTLTGSVLRFVQWVPSQGAYITVGTSGVAFYSQNNGATWTSIAAATTNILRNVSAGTNYVWAVGNSGTILRLQASVLPVELTSLNANVVSGKVHINWTCGSEINNRGFEVQRKVVTSNDNGNWQSICFKQGAGTTTQGTSYTYIDDYNSTEVGKLYYRLKQIDFDGRYNYSQEIEVNLSPADFVLEQNFPNPFNPVTKIKFGLATDSQVELRVLNALGEEVATLINKEVKAGNHEIEFKGSELSSGIYFVTLNAYTKDGQKFSSTKKMTLLK